MKNKILMFVLMVCLIIPCVLGLSGCKQNEKKDLSFWSNSAYYVEDFNGEKYMVLDCVIKNYDEDQGIVHLDINKFKIKSTTALYYVEYITYIRPENGFVIGDADYIRVDSDVVRIHGRYYFVIRSEEENCEPLKLNSLAEIYYDGNKIGTFNYFF